MLGLTFIEEAPYAKHYTLAFRSDEQLRSVSEAIAPKLSLFRRTTVRLEELRKLIPKYRRRGQDAELRRANAEFTRLVRLGRTLCRELYHAVSALRGPSDVDVPVDSP